MVETISYVPAKEGLAALDRFVGRRCGYNDLSPFTLPVRYYTPVNASYSVFRFRYGVLTSAKKETAFSFSLLNRQIASLGDNLYVRPHVEATRGANPYFWLNINSGSEADSPVLTSCRLRPEADQYKFDFRYWHGLEEQLLADYILGINDLRFEDLLPFDLAIQQTDSLHRFISAVRGLGVQIRKGLTVDDTLKVVPKTDDQRLYEWFDILKVDKVLPEEKWPLMASYRIFANEHRINSKDWLGYERQLLFDRIQDESHIKFGNLRPIRAIATSGGIVVILYAPTSGIKRVIFSVKPGMLVQGEETISIPRQDDQGIYEWLELYRFNPCTNGPRGEVLASGRITPDGLNQRDWLGVERQLLKDYVSGLVHFDHLKPTAIKLVRSRDNSYLWSEENKVVYLRVPLSFNLNPYDELTLVPEKETEAGTDFLLIKDNTSLARYRLDLKTKIFTCVDNFVETEPKDVSINPEEADEELRRLMED